MRKDHCELCGPPAEAEYLVCSVSDSGRSPARRLCGNCARDCERIVFGDGGLSVTEALTTLVVEPMSLQSEQNRTKVCPVCGNGVSDVLEAGMTGCSTCYTVFRTEVDGVISQLHGADGRLETKCG